MDKKSEMVEVAILKCHTHYTACGDSIEVLARLIGEDWVRMTRRELETLKINLYDISRELGIESIVVFEKPSKIETEVTLSTIKVIIDKKEAERKAREARAEKARQALEARTQEQKVAKAKKALEKAQKVLREAGEIK